MSPARKPAKKAKKAAKKPAKKAAKARRPKTAKAPQRKAGAGTSLAARISAAPRMRDTKAAQTRVKDWLAQARADGKKLAALFAANSSLAALIASLSENSPFLWQITSAEPARLLRILQADPDAHFAALLSDAAAALAVASDDAAAMRLLRRLQAEAALLIALADIGGVWPVMRTTRALTELADCAVANAVRYLLTDAAASGKLKPRDRALPQGGSGYIVLAMGKMGAFELNYSSDIDLIVLYDPEAPALPKDTDLGTLFTRLTQRLVRLLAERTTDGYVFRTDLRLRPDPASTPIAISTPSALTYYESIGQNWERAAMIKARVCAGDEEAGKAFLDALTPFVWRKYLDFAAVADVQAMKQQIHAYRGHGEIAVEGHNIKLGRGGIREIEFFAQTQQLIAGGRNPALRDRETLPTLEKLADGGWIDKAACEEMTEAYLFLRTVEHRLQMVDDEQTQTLPDDRDGLERFARFMGFASRDAFAKVLLGHLGKVQRQYAKLFDTAPAAAELSFPVETDDRRTLDRLAQMGFKKPLEASSRVRQWFSATHRSLRGEGTQTLLRDLVPALAAQFARTENPDATLILFDSFLANLHGAQRLLSLLRQNPSLISLMAIILGTAPRLADILARYPQVMDGLVEPGFFGTLPGEADLTKRLDAALGQARYDEDLLERIRMFGLEQMFLIGVRILTGTVTAAQAGEAFARLADIVIRAVHRAVAANFAATHGHLRKEASAVLALGKLGGHEMTATSDLDLILVYDFDEAKPESDGKRRLYGGQYFARLTQRLINALTAQTNYGALYQVDMRLRPSGRSGPVATSIEGFKSYQETEAWTWEHLALTRARVVSGEGVFKRKVEAAIREVLRNPRDAALIAGDVVEMRSAIAQEKGDAARWDLKYAAGGLIDIEFIAQYLQLVHAEKRPDLLDTSTARVLEKARKLSVLSAEDSDVLRPAVLLYQNLTQILRLCLTAPFVPKTASPALLRMLARAGDVPDFAALEATVVETQAKVRESFVRILGAEPEAKPLGAERL